MQRVILAMLDPSLGDVKEMTTLYSSRVRLDVCVIKSMANTTPKIIYFVQRMSYHVTHLPRLTE